MKGRGKKRGREREGEKGKGREREGRKERALGACTHTPHFQNKIKS